MRCEASVCGMEARVCAVVCAALHVVYAVCCVCAVSGEDVGWVWGVM
jgi:hypothetical protein